jgi:hypothetical protein
LFVRGKPNGELDLERIGDRPGDFVLECKRAVQLAVISFRPNAKTVSRVNQFGCHTNAVTLALQTSFKHISNVEFFSNSFVFFPFNENDEVRPATRKPSTCAQRMENLLAYAVTQIFLIFRLARIGKW